jgi:serine/threonine protein kinase
LILILVMEYCSGGDLFSYIEQRGFRLPEKRACELVNKLAMAISYLHSYGIAHRDLKPENILMTDNTDTADMRLLDFGLSKIIGPNETCTEPYGTLVSKNMLIKYLLF